LRHEDFSIRLRAINLVASEDPCRFTPELAELAQNDVKAVVLSAALALGGTRDEEWIPLLVKIARDDTIFAADGALEGLVGLGSPGALSALEDLAASSKTRLRRRNARGSAYRLRQKLQPGSRP
jgi:HEAT repeat protein